jgi:hypothetical protein
MDCSVKERESSVCCGGLDESTYSIQEIFVSWGTEIEAENLLNHIGPADDSMVQS